MNHSEALLNALRIGMEDLEANRKGTLGPAQRRKLLRSGTNNLVGAILISGVLIAASLYGRSMQSMAPIQWILVGILCVLILVVGLQYFLRTRVAIKEGRVESLVGPVHIHHYGRAGWHLNVAGLSFHLPIQPALVTQDAVYRVYVAPRADCIVGLEPQFENVG